MITDNVIQEYYDQCKELVRSITIKISAFADLINADVILKNGTSAVDTTDATTWKYYMNIAGEYHATDSPMYVLSLDTAETILFSVDNLALHPNTKEAYQVGLKYYKRLIATYPDQVALIRGILSPVAIQTAIDADDGTIMSYGGTYVEDQEYSLIQNIQNYIIDHIKRWYVTAYTVTHEYYPAAYLGVLTAGLIPLVMNLRDEKRGTYEVHSFHVKAKLASHNYLDAIYPYLTLKQALWLYRNIDRLQRYSGFTSQLSELIPIILTERNIPISSHTVHLYNGFDEDYYPQTTVRTRPLNASSDLVTDSYGTLTHLFKREETVVPGTTLFYEDNADNVELSIQNNSSSTIQTKDLDSEMVNFENFFPDNLESVVMRYWAYLASEGLYKATIVFKHPLTEEEYVITADVAFQYIWYLTLCNLGLIPTIVPDYYVLKMYRTTQVTAADLLKLVAATRDGMTDLAADLVTRQITYSQLSTVSAFNSFFMAIYLEHIRQFQLGNNTQDMDRKAYIRNMIYGLYEDRIVEFQPDTVSIDSFLTDNNLPAYDGNVANTELLITAVYSAGTGITDDQYLDPEAVQRAMIQVMRSLSSYSVQYIYSITGPNTKNLNWAGINLSETVGLEIDALFGVYGATKVLGVETEMYGEVTIYDGTISIDGLTLEIPPYEYNLETSNVTIEGGMTSTYDIGVRGTDHRVAMTLEIFEG